MGTDTETLHSEIQRKVQDYGGEMTGLTSDDIADEIMQLVEEHTRLAVEKALAEQSEDYSQGYNNGWQDGYNECQDLEAIKSLEPKLDISKHEGGYDCCGCNTLYKLYQDILDILESD